MHLHELLGVLVAGMVQVHLYGMATVEQQAVNGAELDLGVRSGTVLWLGLGLGLGLALDLHGDLLG